MYKRILGISAVILFASSPVFAQTSSDLQEQIQRLMKQIAELQTKMVAQKESMARPQGVSNCPALSRVLMKNMRGDDVQGLQSFLIGRGLLAADSGTGYFGGLTEAAVKKYQCDSSLVCAGSPASTGWGAVGPRTRASIVAQCGAASTSGASNSSTPSSSNGVARNDTKPVDDTDDGLPYVPRIPQKAGLTAAPNAQLSDIDSILTETGAADATDVTLED